MEIIGRRSGLSIKLNKYFGSCKNELITGAYQFGDFGFTLNKTFVVIVPARHTDADPFKFVYISPSMKRANEILSDWYNNDYPKGNSEVIIHYNEYYSFTGLEINRLTVAKQPLNSNEIRGLLNFGIF